MATYYIDNVNGLDTNDGLSENTPRKDYHSLSLKGGDRVLFKCGSFIRAKLDNVSGDIDNPITYSSYGQGEKPTFCGSVDMTDKNMWTEVSKNIWKSNYLHSEACNFIFDGGKACGTLCWSFEDLKKQGDFFDNNFGYENNAKPLSDDHAVFMYSVGNPGALFNSIECAVYGKRCLANNGTGIVFEGLRFWGSGVHAIASGSISRNLTVRECDFEFIGGNVWSKERKIRFGNAVECWNIAENILVENCKFADIYDSGVTHQGGKECVPAKNFIVRNNVFIKCGMAAYEQRDLLPLYAEFSNNVCIDAGEGFSKLGEEMPRHSEIYPQPMGHHIFLWRIEKPTDNGKLVICDNTFINAPYGTSIYSIICKEAEAQTILCGNNYVTSDSDYLSNRWDGVNFKTFDEYNRYGFEKGAKSEKVEIKL